MNQFLEGIDGGLILMLVVYSGLASWLAAWLTRSKSDATAASRLALKESLELLERLKTTRELVSTAEHRRELEIMYARIETEIADRTNELNGVANLLHVRPSAQYVVLPRPRTMLGAVLAASSILFFWSGGAAIARFITEYFLREAYSLNTATGQEALLSNVGVGVALIALGFLWRYFAFIHYDAQTLRMRAIGAEATTTQ